MQKTKAVESPEVVKMDALVIQTIPQVTAIRLSPIKDQAGYLQTGALLTQLKALLERIDEERKAIVGPLNKVVKHVNEKCRPFTDLVNTRIAEAKRLMIAYDDMKFQEAQKAAEKEARRAEKKGAVELAADIRTHAQESGGAGPVAGVTFKTRTLGRVTNLESLLKAIIAGKAPAGLISVNEQQLHALARSPADMPAGTERYEEKIAAVSAG